MKEPWIRVVKKAELGKRETLILRLERSCWLWWQADSLSC